MSIHRSLRGVNTLVGERSVLTRVERIERLAKEGKFDLESDSPLGLPKVRTKFNISVGKKARALADARDEAIGQLESKG
ncbi:MAG: small basic protein [Planctomycetota bacterium]|nr:small basic protein [Planctomycetota bacterium]